MVLRILKIVIGVFLVSCIDSGAEPPAPAPKVVPGAPLSDDTVIHPASLARCEALAGCSVCPPDALCETCALQSVRVTDPHGATTESIGAAAGIRGQKTLSGRRCASDRGRPSEYALRVRRERCATPVRSALVQLDGAYPWRSLSLSGRPHRPGRLLAGGS